MRTEDELGLNHTGKADNEIPLRCRGRHYATANEFGHKDRFSIIIRLWARICSRHA
jgi:hypothetical protein